MVAVAALAASAWIGPPGVTITATCRWTRSAITACKRSYWPCTLWYSTVTFWLADFVKAFAEGGHKMCDDIGWPDVDEPYHRHSRLLRARRHRPCRRAAQQRDDLAPPHGVS